MVPDAMMNALINLGSYLPGEQTLRRRIDCVDSRQDTRFDERPPEEVIGLADTCLICSPGGFIPSGCCIDSFQFMSALILPRSWSF
ncbi:hypothetical protein CDAR_27291 [Caerostris darwini]|uniref:Uncharacterized protein n=1 Tax=Caerostris darwini TaxID=1538125 RepID=A0AAV4RBV0_9ARAC|nr:hypothetical protein CDAR_27291 [Caerostris darwini]